MVETCYKEPVGVLHRATSSSRVPTESYKVGLSRLEDTEWESQACNIWGKQNTEEQKSVQVKGKVSNAYHIQLGILLTSILLSSDPALLRRPRLPAQDMQYHRLDIDTTAGKHKPSPDWQPAHLLSKVRQLDTPAVLLMPVECLHISPEFQCYKTYYSTSGVIGMLVSPAVGGFPVPSMLCQLAYSQKDYWHSITETDI